MYSTVCLCDRELQMRFSPFETFYPRHVQRPITLAVCEICFTLLERLIHLLSNGMTNSIFNYFDIRLISLEHVTYCCDTFMMYILVSYIKII